MLLRGATTRALVPLMAFGELPINERRRQRYESKKPNQENNCQVFAKSEIIIGISHSSESRVKKELKEETRKKLIELKFIPFQI